MPDDIYFLDFAEARARTARASDARRWSPNDATAYAAELRRRHIPRLLLSDGTEPEAVAAAGRGDRTAR